MPDLDAQRLALDSAKGFEIGARHRAPDRGEIGSDLAPDITAVEILEPGIGKLRQHAGERRLAKHGALFGQLAFGEERGGEAWCRRQRLEFGGFVACHRSGHRKAFARKPRGVGEEIRERHAAAEALRELLGKCKTTNRAGHGERREGASRGDRVVALFAIARDRCLRARASASLDDAHAPPRVGDQPEAVSTERVHMRIDDRDGRRHGEHRLDGVAALGHHGAPALGRKPMRRDGREMRKAPVGHEVREGRVGVVGERL